MPGCDCDNKNFRIAYEDQVSAVQALHQDWSPRDVKIEVANFLRPKFKLDIASIKDERNGVSQTDGLVIELTVTGDIFYPQYGRTLSELDQRTKTLTPDQYHPS